jgi:ABC-type multidrug transport system ATPase subunit
VLLNDKYPLTQQVFGKFGNYVMQDDILFKYFTVKEALTFAARLKLKCSEAI